MCPGCRLAILQYLPLPPPRPVFETSLLWTRAHASRRFNTTCNFLALASGGRGHAGVGDVGRATVPESLPSKDSQVLNKRCDGCDGGQHPHLEAETGRAAVAIACGVVVVVALGRVLQLVVPAHERRRLHLTCD